MAKKKIVHDVSTLKNTVSNGRVEDGQLLHLRVDTFVPYCICGWKGEETESQLAAIAEAEAHGK